MRPTLTVKEYAWSYMAGWYAGNGCDDFYRCLWDDDAIVAELKSRLEESGVWPIIEHLTTLACMPPSSTLVQRSRSCDSHYNP